MHAMQIHQLVEAQRWAVQAWCRMDMSKLINIVQDLNKDRQANVTPSSPVEARCLLVRPCPRLYLMVEKAQYLPMPHPIYHDEEL